LHFFSLCLSKIITAKIVPRNLLEQIPSMAGDGMSVPIRGDYLSFALSPGGLLLTALGGVEPDGYSAWGIDDCVPCFPCYFLI